MLCYWLSLCNGAQIKTDYNLKKHIDQENLLARRGFRVMCKICLCVQVYEIEILKNMFYVNAGGKKVAIQLQGIQTFELKIMKRGCIVP